MQAQPALPGADQQAIVAVRVAAAAQDLTLVGKHDARKVRDAGPDRGAVRIAREVHEAAVADAHAVEPGPLGLGTVLAEHADADHDEPGIEVGRPDVPSLHCPRAEVLADHVGASRQASEQLLAPGPAQVEGRAPPSSSLDRPEQRVAVLEGADGAHEVSARRLLDLDDLGAHLAEEPGTEGSSEAGPDVDHPQALEGPRH